MPGSFEITFLVAYKYIIIIVLSVYMKIVVMTYLQAVCMLSAYKTKFYLFFLDSVLLVQDMYMHANHVDASLLYILLVVSDVSGLTPVIYPVGITSSQCDHLQ